MSIIRLEYSNANTATFEYFSQANSGAVFNSTIELQLAAAEELETNTYVTFGSSQDPLPELNEVIGTTITLMNYDLLTDSNNSFLGSGGGGGGGSPTPTTPVQRWG